MTCTGQPASAAVEAVRVAVKVLRELVSRDADVVQRFQREAQSASMIGHENIIEIIDFGFTPGGASFLRCSISAAHTPNQITKLINTFAEL